VGAVAAQRLAALLVVAGRPVADACRNAGTNDI